MWTIKHPFILLFESKIKLILIMWTIKNHFILLFESKINLILIMWKIENPFILLFESKIKLILILWTIKNPFILLFESKINSFWFSDNKIKSYLILIPTGLTPGIVVSHGRSKEFLNEKAQNIERERESINLLIVLF